MYLDRLYRSVSLSDSINTSVEYTGLYLGLDDEKMVHSHSKNAIILYNNYYKRF